MAKSIKVEDVSKVWRRVLMDELLEKAVQEIARNHRKIIDDWCKAYLAQLYEEGIDIKPGCFTLNEQNLDNTYGSKVGKRYWFEKGKPKYPICCSQCGCEF